MAYEAIKWICAPGFEPIVQFLKAKIDAAVMTEEYQAFHKKNANDPASSPFRKLN